MARAKTVGAVQPAEGTQVRRVLLSRGLGWREAVNRPVVLQYEAKNLGESRNGSGEGSVHSGEQDTWKNLGFFLKAERSHWRDLW